MIRMKHKMCTTSRCICFVLFVLNAFNNQFIAQLQKAYNLLQIVDVFFKLS